MINEFFDKIYCYILPDETERKESCLKEFEKHSIDVTFFEAVDRRNAQKTNSVAPCHLGIVETVIKIIEEAKEQGFEKILLFQSDVVMNEKFNDIFNENIVFLPEDWDFISLGCTTFSLNKRINGRIFKAKTPTLDHAIGINSKVFDLYLSYLKTMEIESDLAITKMLEEREDINYYFFKSYIATQGQFYSSYTNSVEYAKDCN